MHALINDLGEKAHVRVLTGATTCKSLAPARGLGKVQHIEVVELWVQQAVREERILLHTIRSSFNTTDLFTKIWIDSTWTCALNISMAAIPRDDMNLLHLPIT